MPGTVLIVDDNQANLSVLVDLLAREKCGTAVAESGQEALEFVRKSPPDVILLDVMMPGIDGFETCKLIKQEPGGEEIPVIFMTALTDTSYVAKGFESGAVDYICKPIRSKEVLARVRCHLTMRQQRKQLQEQNALLEKSNAQRDRFMQILAHEIRNPITSISLGCAILKKELASPSANGNPAKLLSMVQSCISTMENLVEGFLDTRRIHSGDFAIQFDEIDLNVPLSQAVEQSESLAKRKKITLDLSLANGPLLIKGDSSRLHQIFTNYISNAIKYSPKGSTTTIRSLRRGSVVRVEVADQGPGIAESERGELFKEFAALSSKPTAGEKSTGLGLWVVAELAKAHNGRVGADFPSSGGSVFWFEMPAVKPK